MPATILVPLDGSDKDARALAVASALGELSDSALHLVRVLPASSLGEPDAATTRRDAADALGRAAASLPRDAAHPVTWAVLDATDVAETLVGYAVERDALLVVLGTRAAGTVDRVLAGSVADRVARECPRPVVLVPPGADYMAGRRITFGRVLVPMDGSALADRALDFLLGLPRADTLEYVLVTVLPPGQGEPSRAGAAAEARLETAAARARERGARAVEVRVTEAPDAAEAIAAAVRECLVELIAMSTRGERGLRRLVLGSVAEGVVRASEMPVLLLTPAMLAAE